MRVVQGHSEVLMFGPVPLHKETAVGQILWGRPLWHGARDVDAAHFKRRDAWYTHDQITELRSQGLNPVLFVAGPGTAIFIPAGVSHAFRIMGGDGLPVEDCFSDIRSQYLEKECSADERDRIAHNKVCGLGVKWFYQPRGDLQPRGDKECIQEACLHVQEQIVLGLEAVYKHQKAKQARNSTVIIEQILYKMTQQIVERWDGLVGYEIGREGGCPLDGSQKRVTFDLFGLLLAAAVPFLLVAERERVTREALTRWLKDNGRPQPKAAVPTTVDDGFANGASKLDAEDSNWFCAKCFTVLANGFVGCRGCEQNNLKPSLLCFSCKLKEERERDGSQPQGDGHQSSAKHRVDTSEACPHTDGGRGFGKCNHRSGCEPGVGKCHEGCYIGQRYYDASQVKNLADRCLKLILERRKGTRLLTEYVEKRWKDQEEIRDYWKLDEVVKRLRQFGQTDSRPQSLGP